jgi:hypothetical protein
LEFGQTSELSSDLACGQAFGRTAQRVANGTGQECSTVPTRIVHPWRPVERDWRAIPHRRENPHIAEVPLRFFIHRVPPSFPKIRTDNATGVIVAANFAASGQSAIEGG